MDLGIEVSAFCLSDRSIRSLLLDVYRLPGDIRSVQTAPVRHSTMPAEPSHGYLLLKGVDRTLEPGRAERVVHTCAVLKQIVSEGSVPFFWQSDMPGELCLPSL